MNSDHLAAKIYATDEKPFIPGYDKNALMMEKYVNFNQMKAKSPAAIAETIHILSQGIQNIICSNRNGSHLFVSQLNATQLKEVGLT